MDEEEEIKIGIGATKLMWTDREPFTVIKVCTKNKLVIQKDDAKPNPNFKAEWVAGGFAGSMINQDQQEWIITQNPNGETVEIRWHKKGGWFDKHGNQYAVGYRHKFYDYNF